MNIDRPTNEGHGGIFFCHSLCRKRIPPMHRGLEHTTLDLYAIFMLRIVSSFRHRLSQAGYDRMTACLFLNER
jgi:hypothetical protein